MPKIRVLFTILQHPVVKLPKFHCHLCKIRINGFFIWSCQKNVVYLHPQFHAGDVCTSSAGVADIFKRRLLALCSDSMKSRKFLPDKNLATIDVLRDIDYPSCAYLVHCLRIHMRAHAYLNLKIAREYIYIRRGLRVVSSNISGNARASWRGTTIVGLHAFLYALTINNNPHSWEFLCKNMIMIWKRLFYLH